MKEHVHNNIRARLSFVVLHLCSQAKCFDLSCPATLCPPALRQPSSHHRAAHPWHSNLLVEEETGFCLKLLLLIFEPLSAVSGSHRHYPPTELTTVPVAEPGLIHTVWLFFLFALTSSAQTTFVKLHLDLIFNKMVKTHFCEQFSFQT